MGPKTKYTQNENSFPHEIKFCLYLFLLRTTWNEINIYFDLLIDYLCIYEVFVWPDVFFGIFSLRDRVYIICITRNEISFLSKWPQWNNTRNDFHFALLHVNSFKRLTRNRIENFAQKMYRLVFHKGKY